MVTTGTISRERVATGVPGLDQVLHGGFLRGFDHAGRGLARNGQDDARAAACGAEAALDFRPQGLVWRVRLPPASFGVGQDPPPVGG